MKELLDHLCELARLQLSAGEREEFARKFADLVEFVDAIKELHEESREVPLQVPKERMDTAPDEPRTKPDAGEVPRKYAAGRIGDLEEGEV
jgi:aspartyl/glutamyl-tRNA(Asn/Gln) amidotransferase C subunit